MSMLHQENTRDNLQTTVGAYDNALPNTEPTDTAYVNWKAKHYTPATAIRAWYSVGHMRKYHKILKRNGKLNRAGMSA